MNHMQGSGMAIRDTSLIAYDKVLRDLPKACQPVFEILLELGPCHNNRILEALNQREQKSLKPSHLKRRWQINQVTGRINDLVYRYPVVEDLGPHRGIWNSEDKVYHFWRVRGDQRTPAGWMSVESKWPNREHHNLKQQASSAGRALREFRKVKGQNCTAPTSQMMLGFNQPL